MTKQFIVRLKKTDGTIVANSQIITVNGIGTGTIVAADFLDNTLTGSVTTSSRTGSFVKTIAAAYNPTIGLFGPTETLYNYSSFNIDTWASTFSNVSVYNTTSASAANYKLKAQNILPIYTQNNSYTITQPSTQTRYGLFQDPDITDLAFYTNRCLMYNWDITSQGFLNTFFSGNVTLGILGMDQSDPGGRHITSNKTYKSPNGRIYEITTAIPDNTAYKLEITNGPPGASCTAVVVNSTGQFALPSFTLDSSGYYVSPTNISTPMTVGPNGIGVIITPLPGQLVQNTRFRTLLWTATAYVAPTPTPTPTQSVGVTPTPTPTPTQSVGVTPTPTPTPTQSVGVTPTPTPTPSSAPSTLSLAITTSSVARISPASLASQHNGVGVNGGGSLYFSGGGSGSGPFWLADQSQPANHVYLVDDRIPAGFNSVTEWPSPSTDWRSWFASDGTTVVTNPASAIYVKNDYWNLDSIDAKGGTLVANGHGLSNWGILSPSGFIITDNDTSLGLPNSNVSCRIPGTPYVFLGLHYGNNSVQLAVGTKLGESGSGTATAISISLYEADGTTLVATVSNPFHTYIPAPNAAGYNGSTYVNNVCWEVIQGSGTFRTNWVDVGQTGNNNSDGSSIVGQLRIRIGNRTPFVLKIQTGHI